MNIELKFKKNVRYIQKIIQKFIILIKLNWRTIILSAKVYIYVNVKGISVLYFITYMDAV